MDYTLCECRRVRANQTSFALEKKKNTRTACTENPLGKMQLGSAERA